MDNLKQAAKIIKQGGIVIYPTDTAFGIGCDMTNEKAVERLFEIRKRPPIQATPVLFDSVERIQKYIYPMNEEVAKLAKKHWPGALTLVLPCIEELIPSMVRGGGKSLGVRIPDHEVPLSLVRDADVPILGPSANFHGDKTPYAYSDLDKELIKLVDFVVEGKTKGGNLASTVVDCTVNPWRIIRQGAVSL